MGIEYKRYVIPLSLFDGIEPPPVWKRLILVGEVANNPFLSVEAGGINEKKAVVNLVYDEADFVVENGHVYACASWIVENCPDEQVEAISLLCEVIEMFESIED